MEEEYKNREMRAYEAFIRRASDIDAPFMLKGSYVTRQYFSNPNDRIPADLDWVYMNKLTDEKAAREVFGAWVTEITEKELTDNVRFRSFTENEFWRRIDYAMADDFPTVNTDLKCWVDDEEFDFGLDVSFNLKIEYPPVPLTYKPIHGNSFVIPNTVPLALQVSWKIHQTLVRPRFKDLFDLIHLVQHPTFDKITLDNALKALLDECSADNVDMNKLKHFLNYNIGKLFPNNSMNETWEYWRHGVNKRNYGGDILYFDKADRLTDATKLPSELYVFLERFKAALEKQGWTTNLVKDLEISSMEEQPKRKEQTTTSKFDEIVNLQGAIEETRVPSEQKPLFWKRIKKLFGW